MLKNYFKIAWRNLERNKLYSFINITGLALGLAVCMLIMLYVGHESSYDSFHKNANRIAWIQGKEKMGNDSFTTPFMSYAAAPLVKQKAPFVESYVRYMSEFIKPIIQNPKLPALKFAEPDFLFADSNFFSFFSFELLQGNKQHVLEKPFTVVITPKMAKKYFGNQDPIGKLIRYNNDYSFTVTGIVDKAPSNSSIEYAFVASLSSLSAIKETRHFMESQIVQFGAFSTFFLIKRAQDAPKLETTLLELRQSANKDGKSKERYTATLLVDRHLSSNETGGANTKYLKIFPFVAALVLLLALINYMSLSTARATIRAKEIGVRKVLGAGRKAIAAQFFVESTLYTAISFVLGYMLCVVFQPLFFKFLQIDVDNSFLHNPVMLLAFSGLFVISVVLAATYPSLLLSAYKPVMVLYGKLSQKSGGVSIRKFFTVFQFSMGILLVVCGIVIDRQMYFFRHADTGVDRDNVLMIPFAQTIGRHYNAFKKETRSLAFVQQTATAHYQMYGGFDTFFTNPKNSNTDISLPIMSVDEHFIPMLGLKWKIPPADSLFYLGGGGTKAILNETAIEKLNLNTMPVGETFKMGTEECHVVGVLKDFNYQSLQDKIDAVAIFIAKENDSVSYWGQVGGCLFVKVNRRANIPVLIGQLKTIYDKYDTVNPFEFHFMDDAFDAMYNAEDRLSKIFSIFTVFILLISCLGLFGLSTFVALQRTKEVGIRKVLGASVSQVTALLSRDFLKLVMIAIVIASPLAWWAMNKWLEAFAYRIHVRWWMFLMAGTMALLIALVTVSFQAVKAAVANPVKSLRSE